MKTAVFAAIIATVAQLLAHEHKDCAGHDHNHEHAKEHNHKEHKHDEHGCDHKHDEHEHDHKHEGGDCKQGDAHKKEQACTSIQQAGKSHKSVEITEAAENNSGLKTTHPRKRKINSETQFQGRFELCPEAREIVASPSAGRLEIKTRSLKQVNKGEILFLVHSPEIASRKKEIEILEKRVSVFRNIKTANAELESQLSIKKAELTAMLAGHPEENASVVIKSHAESMVEKLISLNGSWVETGTAVLMLSNPSKLRFKGLIPAEQATRLKDGMPVSLGDENGELRLGIGDDSGLVPVYVIFNSSVKGAIAGEKATASVSLGGSGDDEVVVPDAAIVEIGMEKHVFIRDAGNRRRFIAYPIKAHASANGWTAVEGLPQGDIEIVSKGAYGLKTEAMASSSGKPSGHFHADGSFHEGEH